MKNTYSALCEMLYSSFINRLITIINNVPTHKHTLLLKSELHVKLLTWYVVAGERAGGKSSHSRNSGKV